MKKLMAAALVLAFAAGGSATAQDAAKPRTDKGHLTLFRGPNFTLDDYDLKGGRPSIDFEYTVSSIAIYPGEKWEVCSLKVYKGQCMVIDKDVGNLGGISILSARPVKQ